MDRRFDTLLFPGGKSRAFTLSYDDAVVQDRRLPQNEPNTIHVRCRSSWLIILRPGINVHRSAAETALFFRSFNRTGP